MKLSDKTKQWMATKPFQLDYFEVDVRTGFTQLQKILVQESVFQNMYGINRQNVTVNSVFQHIENYWVYNYVEHMKKRFDNEVQWYKWKIPDNIDKPIKQLNDVFSLVNGVEIPIYVLSWHEMYYENGKITKIAYHISTQFLEKS